MTFLRLSMLIQLPTFFAGPLEGLRVFNLELVVCLRMSTASSTRQEERKMTEIGRVGSYLRPTVYSVPYLS